MSKYIDINTLRAQNAIQNGNMELASRLFQVCDLIAQAIAAGETEETARGKYLIAVSEIVAQGKEI